MPTEAEVLSKFAKVAMTFKLCMKDNANKPLETFQKLTDLTHKTWTTNKNHVKEKAQKTIVKLLGFMTEITDSLAKDKDFLKNKAKDALEKDYEFLDNTAGELTRAIPTSHKRASTEVSTEQAPPKRHSREVVTPPQIEPQQPTSSSSTSSSNPYGMVPTAGTGVYIKMNDYYEKAKALNVKLNMKYDPQLATQLKNTHEEMSKYWTQSHQKMTSTEGKDDLSKKLDEIQLMASRYGGYGHLVTHGIKSATTPPTSTSTTTTEGTKKESTRPENESRSGITIGGHRKAKPKDTGEPTREPTRGPKT